MEFLSGFIDALAVTRVDDKDKALGASIVMSPERPNFILSSNVPYIEFDLQNVYKPMGNKGKATVLTFL